MLVHLQDQPLNPTYAVCGRLLFFTCYSERESFLQGQTAAKVKPIECSHDLFVWLLLCGHSEQCFYLQGERTAATVEEESANDKDDETEPLPVGPELAENLLSLMQTVKEEVRAALQPIYS